MRALLVLGLLGGTAAAQVIEGPLSDAQVRKVVRKNLPALDPCVPEGREGPVVLKLTVDVNGRAALRELNLPSAAECIREAMKQWRFPKVGAPSDVVWPVKVAEVRKAARDSLRLVLGSPELGSRDQLFGTGPAMPEGGRPLPPPARGHVTLEPPTVTGGTGRAIVEPLLRSRTEAIGYCYDRALERAPKLAGKLTLHFHVAADGKASELEVLADRLKDDGLLACVKPLAVPQRFPQPTGPLEVEYSMRFSLLERARDPWIARRGPRDSTPAERIIREHWLGLGVCLDKVVERTVSLRLSIEPNGRATLVDLQPRGPRACVAGEVKQWRFPKSAARAEVRYPIDVAALGDEMKRQVENVLSESNKGGAVLRAGTPPSEFAKSPDGGIVRP